MDGNIVLHGAWGPGVRGAPEGTHELLQDKQGLAMSSVPQWGHRSRSSTGFHATQSPCAAAHLAHRAHSQWLQLLGHTGGAEHREAG